MGKRVGALEFLTYSCSDFYVFSQNLIVNLGPGFFSSRSLKT